MKKCTVKFFTLLVLVTSLTTNLLYSLNPRDLYQTYTPLPKDYKSLSPITGAILSETGVLWNYYKLGLDDESSIKLVKNLFHEALGSFVISRSKNRIAAHISPNLIGKIVGAIYVETSKEKPNFENLKEELNQVIKEDDFFLKSVKKTQELFDTKENEIKKIQKKQNFEILNSFKKKYPTDKQIQKINDLKTLENEIEKRIKNISKQYKKLADPEKLKKQIDALGETIKELEAKESKTKKEEGKLKGLKAVVGKMKKRAEILDLEKVSKDKKLMEEKLDFARTQETFLKKENEKVKKHEKIKQLEKQRYDNNFDQKKNINDFVNNIVDSLEEKEEYPANFTKTVLLAFLYEKSENREDLWNYFLGIENQLDKNILDVEKEKWINTSYTENSKDIEKENNEFFKKEFYEENIENLDKYFEKIAIVKILYDCYLGDLPQIVEYKKVSFESIEFSDCMETALKNLILIGLLYENSFQNLDKIKKSNPTEKFKKFLEELTPSNISDIEFHQKWSDLIQNKKYVTYMRLKLRGKNQQGYFGAPLGFEGFIILDDKDKVKNLSEIKVVIGNETQYFKYFSIEDQKYIIVDPKKYSVFEVLPSIRNATVILNDLFGFNLIEDKENSFFKVFSKENFSSLFFKKVCKGLNIKALTGIKSDYGKIEFKKKKSKFEFSFSRGHGEISKSKEAKINFGIEPEAIKLFNNNLIKNELLFWNLITLLRPNIQILEKEFSENLIKSKFLFLSNLMNISVRLQVINNYLYEKEFFKNINKYIIKNIVESLPINHEVLDMFITWIEYRDIKDKFIFDKAVNLATEGIKHFDIGIRKKNIKLLHALMKKDIWLKEASGFVKKRIGISVSDPYYRLFLKDLLMKKNKFLNEVTKNISIHTQAPQNKNSEIIKFINNIIQSSLNNLSSEEFYIENILPIIMTLIKSELKINRNLGVDFVNKVFNKIQDEFIERINKHKNTDILVSNFLKLTLSSIKNKYNIMISSAIKLLSYLIPIKKHEEIITIANELIKDPRAQQLVFDFLKDVYIKNEYIDSKILSLLLKTAENKKNKIKAKKLLEKIFKETKRNLLDSFKKKEDNEKEIKLALDLASIGIDHGYTEEYSLSLIRRLMHKNKRLDEIIKLFVDKIEKGYVYNEEINKLLKKKKWLKQNNQNETLKLLEQLETKYDELSSEESSSSE